MTEEIDVTKVDHIPKRWRCPHCQKLQTMNDLASEIFRSQRKVLRNCDKCGNVHMWELER